MGFQDIDKKLRELYEEERSKISPLPDSDSDFIALEKALLRYSEENRNVDF